MLVSLAAWLQSQGPEFGWLRVVQYLTFRAVMAAMTALLIGLVAGPWVIRRLAELPVGHDLPASLTRVVSTTTAPQRT